MGGRRDNKTLMYTKHTCTKTQEFTNNDIGYFYLKIKTNYFADSFKINFKSIA